MKSYAFPRSKPGNALPLHAGVAATAAALPEEIVTNEQIIEQYHHRVSAAAIDKMVGTAERRVAPKGIADSDLLCEAASRCLERAGVAADELGKLIVTRFVGDRLLPMTASLLQKKMACRTAIQAFDISGGVHSFLEAINTAACAVESDAAPVLVVSGGITNRLISRTDPRIAFLFGDGAAAVLLTRSNRPRILASYSFSNSSFADTAVAFRYFDHAALKSPCESQLYDSLFDLYRQDAWQQSMDYVLDAMGVTARTLLSDADKRAAEVDLWLITENSRQLYSAIVERLEIPKEKTLSLLSRYGNTMSAMLPLILNEAIETGKAVPGSLVMMLSIGEGLKGGGILLEL